MTYQAPPPAAEEQAANTPAEAAAASGAPPPPAPAPAPPAAEQPRPAPAAPRVAMTHLDTPPEVLFMDSDNVIELWHLAGFLANSDLLPDRLTRKISPERARNNVFLMMLVGKDRGMSPIQALSGGLHIIEGKVEIGSHAMVALCLKSGACEYLAAVSSECNERKAVYRTRRRGWPEGKYEDFTFTIEDAASMRLLNRGKDEYAKANSNWQKMPQVMLRRRAASFICREYYPDVVLGLYDHGEISELFEPPGTITVMPPGTDVSDSKPAGVSIADAPYKPRDPLADRIKAKTEASREAEERQQETTRPGRRPPPRRAGDVGTCEACGTLEQTLDLAGRCPACR